MDSTVEENVNTLLTMGFMEEKVRKALKQANNDLNDAISYLTCETTDSMNEIAMEQPPLQRMKNLDIPAYDEVVKDTENGNISDCGEDDETFPMQHLFDLEHRVYCESWSIPFKNDESFARCMISSTKLMKAGTHKEDDNCIRFMDHCLPECFNKLLGSQAVHRWFGDVQEGIYEMTNLFMQLLVERLNHPPLPYNHLNILSMVFNPNVHWNVKNKHRGWASGMWTNKFGGEENLFARPIPSIPYDNGDYQFHSDYGWMLNLINKFCELDGISKLAATLDLIPDVTATHYAALLQPFALCGEYLNPPVVNRLLSPIIERSVEYIHQLTDEDFRVKSLGAVSDLLSAMKGITRSLWTKDLTNVDELRLETTLRMIKCPHFNAKMNALKEISKLIEEINNSNVIGYNGTHVEEEKFHEWLSKNNILSISLDGHIDQSQYSDKIRVLVEFIGDKLCMDELAQLWMLQEDASLSVAENIQIIVASAAPEFNEKQLDVLYQLVHKSWFGGDERARLQLISFIGLIGKKSRSACQADKVRKVLTLLWDLAHLPKLSHNVVESALHEHHNILMDAYAVKDSLHKDFVVRCIEDIKKESWIVPAFRQMYELLRTIVKTQAFRQHKSERAYLSELNRSHELIKLVVSSLSKCHQISVDSARKQNVPLIPDTLVDGRYKHSEYMRAHLVFLKFLLKEGDLYLSWSRARDLWDSLAGNKHACDGDVRACCEWFVANLSDLDCDSGKNMFKERLLKIDVVSMAPEMFECIQAFMDLVNMNEDKIKKVPNDHKGTVEKLDLIGLDHLWKICLECLNQPVVDLAMTSLVRYSYLDVGKKLKQDAQSLHGQFLTECYQRLETLNNVEDSTVVDTVTTATKTLVGSMLPDINTTPVGSHKSQKMTTTERLLSIVNLYITRVEASYPFEPRSSIPHGESFYVKPLSIFIKTEGRSMEIDPGPLISYSNYPVRYLRVQVSQVLECTPDSVQMYANGKCLSASHDRYSLESIGFTELQEIQVKTVLPHSTPMEPSLNKNDKLPSLLLAKLAKIYETLFSLSDYDYSQINERVRKILLLLPSDPRIRQKIESINTDSYSSLKSGLNDSVFSKDESFVGDSSGVEGMAIDGATISNRHRLNRSFESLFQLRSPGMNLFRLRYNLEVLSSILMPVTCPETQIQDSSFVHAFLRNNGLQTILNVLQREILQESNEKIYDPETRQGCFATALEIAKYVLCCPTVSDSVNSDEDSMKQFSASSDAAHSPMKRDAMIVGPAEASVTPIKRNRRSVSRSPAILSSPLVARTSVQLMSADDYTVLIRNLTQITWFASTGRLDQLNSDATALEMTGFSKRKWSRESGSSLPPQVSPFRQTSGGSISSSTSATDISHQHQNRFYHHNSLHRDIKDNTESHVARQALRILVSCLQNRSSHLDSFFDMPNISDFVIDVLIRSPDLAIRTNAVEQFYQMSKIESSGKKHPRAHLLQILTKCPLPYWRTNTSLRAGAQALVNNCLEYFSLRCQLLKDTMADDNVSKSCLDETSNALSSEIDWLTDWETPTSLEYFNTTSARHLDNVLLTGHLRLITVLLASPRNNKKEIGTRILGRLLHHFLFPGARLIVDHGGNQISDQSPAAFMPKCNNDDSRNAGFELVVELCKNCTENLQFVSVQLITMHHFHDPSKIKEFGFTPLTTARPDHGLVGLRNAGATCYMNSVIQQLFMMNQIRLRVLSNDLVDIDEPEKGVLYQLQKVFAHLCHSRMQYHIPTSFWKTFRCWNNGQTEINLREQQDAFEFYTHLTDQIDEFAKKKGRETIFKSVFKGVFSDQKICEGCPHKYDREELFYALNLPVKCRSLHESLKQFVAGEKLEGDNAYFCERCSEKRTALKRTCIKSLPDVLPIQLKRFVYDWEAGRSVKFDQYFSFPLEIDMKQYMVEATENGTGVRKEADTRKEDDRDIFELVGTVVHSGQATAGHYYSFIKDRRNAASPTYGKWFKFNDTQIEEFYMNERALEEECFGGSFVGKVYDKGTAYDDERIRYWSAYILFYQRKKPTPVKSVNFAPPDLQLLNKKTLLTSSPIAVVDSGNSSADEEVGGGGGGNHISNISQLSNLIKKGEQRGVFNLQIPSSIIKLVQEENIHFMRDCGMCNPAYFKFIKDLVFANMEHTGKNPAIAVHSMQLATNFLFNTFFKMKLAEAYDQHHWQNFMRNILSDSPAACAWFAGHLSSPTGFGVLTAHLLECPYESARQAFTKMLICLIRCMTFNSIEEKRSIQLDPLLSRIVALMDREVIERVKYSEEYFSFLSEYSGLGRRPCEILLRHDCFSRLMKFLLGEKATKPMFRKLSIPTDGSGDAPCVNSISSRINGSSDMEGEKPMSIDGEDDNMEEDDEVIPRRWASSSCRSFFMLHRAICNFIIATDLTSLRNKPTTVAPSSSSVTEMDADNDDSVSPASSRSANETDTTPMQCSGDDGGQQIAGKKLLPLTEQVRLAIEGVVAKRYFQELLTFTRENHDHASTCLTREVINYCGRDNSRFSSFIIDLMMSELPTLPAGDTHGWLVLLSEILCTKDSIQLERLKMTFENTQNNFLNILELSHRASETKCYQYIKFVVTLSSRSDECNRYLMDISQKWASSVTWLKRKMNDYGWASGGGGNAKKDNSNNLNTSKHFQRTVSAQNTLDKATALLGACVQQDNTDDSSIQVEDVEIEDSSL